MDHREAKAPDYHCHKCQCRYNPDGNCILREKDETSVFCCPQCGDCVESQDDLE